MSSSEKPGQYVLLVDAFRFFKRPEELRLLSYLDRKLFFTKASGLWLKSFQPKYSSFENFYFDYFPSTLFQSWRVGEVLFRKRNPPHTWDGWTYQSTKGEMLMINQWLVTDSGLISLRCMIYQLVVCIALWTWTNRIFTDHRCLSSDVIHLWTGA